jgi:hypothetical protein
MYNEWGAKYNMMHVQEQPKHITHNNYFTTLPLAFLFINKSSKH